MKKLIERPRAVPAKSKAKAFVPGSAMKVPAAINEAALLGDLRTLAGRTSMRCCPSKTG